MTERVWQTFTPPKSYAAFLKQGETLSADPQTEAQMQMERVGRLLVAGLRDEPTAEDVADFAQLTTADGSTLLALATSLGLDPLLYDRLTVNGLNVHLPCSIRSQLQASYYRQAAHNLRLYGELGALVDALHQAKIPVIVLKGAHLAATVYPDIALRKMVDIDLMVAEPQLTAAFEVVQGLGYLPLEPSAPTAPVTTLHHLPRLFKAEALAGVEIHWTIAHPGKPYALANVAELWTRAQPVQLAGIQALGLHPADLLLHLCLHATHHHRLVQGLRPLCDIDRVVRCYGEGFDWQAIGERAQAQKWDKGVHLMLYLAQIWFNTPVPESFLQAIQPAGFTPQRIESALRYMLLDRPPEGEISGEFSHMWRQSSLGGKVKMLLKRWFLPRTTMSEMYPVAADSPWLWIYYLVRLRDLLIRYSHPTRRLLGGDAQTHLLTDQQSLRRWLSE